MRVSSAPVIGRTPASFAAWANASDPLSPSWSVRAIAGYPYAAACSASSSGADAPSRKLNAECACSSMYGAAGIEHMFAYVRCDRKQQQVDVGARARLLG